DGTVLEARIQDLQWQIAVTESGVRDNGLQVGDVLLGEIATSTGFLPHTDLATAMDRLTSSGLETALFEVRRGEERLDVTVPLARAPN
ncbi:MAG: hypothetical protein HKP37_09500, partial [Boseongicola sp.]|nr:hypothetical protein [Boseongicola sp.]